jgi:hypothetical protein
VGNVTGVREARNAQDILKIPKERIFLVFEFKWKFNILIVLTKILWRRIN